jgi:ribonuclease BN (tRNA processing enzyme)
LKQLNIFGPKGTIGFTDKLIEAFISSRGPRLMKNISVKDVGEGFVHKTNQWEIECVDTTHGTLFNHLSLGYRIAVAGKSIVISGDITMPSLEAGSRDDSYALNRKLIELAENADLFIMDASLSHTTIGDLGRAAKRANVKKVVLTHTWEPGIRSRIPAVYSRNPGEIGVQPPFNEFIAEINKIYDGEVIAAEDLKAITI